MVWPLLLRLGVPVGVRGWAAIQLCLLGWDCHRDFVCDLRGVWVAAVEAHICVVMTV